MESDSRNFQNDSLKALVIDLIIQRDSAKSKVDTVIVERTKVLTRYREVRHTDTIPCEEKLAICDTIIKIDSNAIAQLNAVIELDNKIISNQGQVILSQDSTITDLEKQVKKERKWKKFWRNATIVVSGIAAGSILTNR